MAEFLDDRCPQPAASISYHVLFSLFPLAIVLAAIFGLVVRTTGIRADVVDAIVRNVPLSPEGDDRLRSLLDLVAGVSLGLTVAVRAAGGAAAHAGVDLGSGWATWILGVAVPFALAFGIVLFLYRVVPAADVSLRDAWPAALLVAAAFLATQNLFAFYVENFANYNAIYGSLGAIVAFTFLVYLSALVFLLGAEVASESPRVRETLRRGEQEEGPPLSQQAREPLKGLWVRQRQGRAAASGSASRLEA